MAEAGVGIPGAEEVAQGDASAKQMEITMASGGGQPGTGTVTSQAPGGPCAPLGSGCRPPGVWTLVSWELLVTVG